ncbi:MAG: cupin domain-containing protein [Stellaceae bacterium]
MNAAEAGILPVSSGEAFDKLRRDWAARPPRAKFADAAGSPEVATPFGPIYVLLRGEETGGQLGFYEQFVAAGTGAGPHHQTTEDEVFYVLEGEWEFQAGADIRRCPPGSLIYAPAHATHAFKSVSPGAPGRMLSWNAPAGHERFYVGMGAARAAGRDPNEVAHADYHVDFTPQVHVPAPGRPAGKFVDRGAAPVTTSGGNLSAMLLDMAETAGRFVVREIDATPGAAPLDTPNPDANRYLFIVAGTWQVAAGDDRRTIGAGTAVLIPAGMAHRVQLAGDAPGRLLDIAAPIGPRH